MATPLCKTPLITQISTGQAGPEVNRDLETLFKTVNRVLQCQSVMADYIDTASSGAFASGAGTTSTGEAGPGIENNGNPQLRGVYVGRVSTGSSYTITYGFTGILIVDATADINVTLPPPESGKPITVIHAGASNTITLKNDGGTTIGTLMTGGVASPVIVEDDDNAPSWATGFTAVYNTGSVVFSGNVHIGDGKLRIASPDGTYWTFSVSDTGTTATDTTGSPAPDP